MLYKILKLMFIFIYSVIFPTKVTGAENVPKSGAVILASNHLSNWDPAACRNIHSAPFGIHGQRGIIPRTDIEKHTRKRAYIPSAPRRFRQSSDKDGAHNAQSRRMYLHVS